MVGRNHIIALAAAAMLFATGSAYSQQPYSAPGHAARAQELYDAGQYRASQEELRKARAAADPADAAERMRIDYMLAECAAKLGEEDALAQVEKFARDYPGSIYADRLRLTGAVCLYDEERYGEALEEFRNIDAPALHGGQRNEYWFKRGYSEFMTGDRRGAATSFQKVGSGEYAPHAGYYTAYIDYTEENYAAAKRGFTALANDPSYGAVIPFYLLQIEFLEGNYDYVIAHGDALLRTSDGVRTAEIARSMAEAWFHREDYGRVMQYIDTYRTAGGRMGREEYYLAGYSEYMQGHPAPAVEALARVAGAPDRLSQNAAYHMAAAYLELDRKREAMQSFSIAADGEFDAAIRENALFNYGKLQFELGGGFFNEAINVLQRYIAEYPQSPHLGEATEYLASAYYNARNYEAAYEAIKRIPNPDNNIKTAFQKIAYFRALDLYNMGEFDRAYTMLEEAHKTRFNAKYTALTNFWMGEIRYLKEDYAGAAKFYRDYTTLAPSTEREYRMALYNLGYSYFNRKSWGEARSWFDRFLAAYTTRDSYRADAYNRLGDIDFANREFWRAIEMYDNAAKVGTDERYYSQFRRAEMLGHVGRPERKIESLNEIIRAGQGGYVPDAMYELGLTYIAQERFRDAAAAMKRFTDAYPDNEKYAAALSDMGLIYQNLGDNDAAVNYYKLVVDKSPGSPEARNAMMALRGIYVEQNDVDAYFAFAQRSGIETDLTTVARDSLAFSAAQNAYLRQGNTTASITALRSYLDRYPRGIYRAEALYYTGDACLVTGRTEDAIASYRELAAMYFNPHTVNALEKLAPLYQASSRHREAADAYKQLADAAANPATVSKALAGYLANTIALGDDGSIEQVALEIEAAANAGEDVKRDARFTRAGALERSGETDAALELYRSLATESHTPVGAWSTLKVIEALYAAGDLDAAQKLVMTFAGQNTPHQQALGRAFLVLGDIYAKKGDTFQARATLQSIIDGYSPADDGVIETAREKIRQLGN